MIPVGADDVEHYSSLYQMEKDGNYLYFLRLKIHSNKCDFRWSFCTQCLVSVAFLVVLDTTVTCDWNVARSLFLRNIRGPPLVRDVMWAFPVPDGQNSASSSWALCYDWLNACPCGERVSECFYGIYVCGEMKRLQTEGRGEDEDGLIKCYNVLLRYSHLLPHRSGCAAMACSPHRRAACPLSLCQLPPHMSLANWNIGIKWMENHSEQTDPIFVSRSAGSNE